MEHVPARDNEGQQLSDILAMQSSIASRMDRLELLLCGLRSQSSAFGGLASPVKHISPSTMSTATPSEFEAPLHRYCNHHSMDSAPDDLPQHAFAGPRAAFALCQAPLQDTPMETPR